MVIATIPATLAVSDHVRGNCADGCLLSGVKRSSRIESVMSAFDPKTDITEFF